MISLISFFFIHTPVVNRIYANKKIVSEIITNNDLNRRLIESGNDEISELGESTVFTITLPKQQRKN
jgi:hypothetical protein